MIKTFFFLNALLCLTQCTIIIKPQSSSASTFQVGYIFIQGAIIPASHYRDYAVRVQSNALDWGIWVAILEFPLNIPDPLQVKSLMEQAFSDLRAQGFQYNETTPFFFGAHSYGGIVLVNYLVENQHSMPFKFRF